MTQLHEPSFTLSVRVTSELKNQLDQLAATEGKTRSFIAEEALKRYLKEESWQVQAIGNAIEKADRENAKFIEHGEVKEWLKIGERLKQALLQHANKMVRRGSLRSSKTSSLYSTR